MDRQTEAMIEQAGKDKQVCVDTGSRCGKVARGLFPPREEAQEVEGVSERQREGEMSNYKITVEIECLPGDKVMVQNYRRKDIWESGTCTSVEIRVRKEGSSPSYEVTLDRKAPPNKRHPWERPLRLGAWRNRIRKIKEG